jgi:hypothetical protein
VSKRAEVAETLRQRCISAQHFGRLVPGGRLPSARVLAVELDADARVVVAAYRTLEREGLVERRPPSRAFYLADQAAGGGAPRTDGRAAGARVGGTAPSVVGDEWMAEMLAQAIERDVAAPDFPEHARRAIELRRLRAACIECNTDQIVWLCRELGDDYGIESAGVELDEVTTLLGRPRSGPRASRPPLAPRDLPPSLRRAELLLTTESHVEPVRELAERSGKPCIVVTQRADLVVELERLLAQGPVYFVGTDPRFASTVRARFSSWAHGARARPVILETGRELESLTGRRPAYVMRTARERLGGVPPHLRVLSTLRAFSAATRREILRHVVRANLQVARQHLATVDPRRPRSG